jgi:hypothetical protein
MKLHRVLSCLIAATLGVAVWMVIRVGYALPGILPTSDLFVSLITSGLAREWMAATNGKAGILIAVLLRAFPWSSTTGFIAGAVFLGRFKYPRVFSYSVLFLPLLSMSMNYLGLSQAHSQQSAALVEAQHLQIWVSFSVLIWFFIAMYLGNLVARGVARWRGAPFQGERPATRQAGTGT